MDNLSSHKRTAVQTAIESVGAKLRLLLPYRTDLNPIDKAFSKWQAKLRAAKMRTNMELEQYLGEVLDGFSPEERETDFVSCGHPPAKSTRELL